VQPPTITEAAPDPVRGSALAADRLPLFAFAAGAAACAAVFAQTSPYHSGSWLPACPFHALTGLYCPGCGSTRALFSLLHGDPARAFSMNPAMVLALPLLLAMVLGQAGLVPAALSAPVRALARPKAWLVVLVLFGVLRNLPFAPFDLLAPH